MAGHVLLVLVALGIVETIALYQRRFHLVQYWFFFRYPLILVASVVSFPLLAVSQGARPLLRNLFALSRWQITVVTCLAIVACLTIMSAGELLLKSIPGPYALPFRRPGSPPTEMPTWVKGLGRMRRFLYGCLAIPNIAVLLVVGEGRFWSKLTWVALGVGLAVGLDRAATFLGRRLESPIARILTARQESSAGRQGNRTRRKLMFVPSRVQESFPVRATKSVVTRRWKYVRGVYGELHHRPPWGVLTVAVILYAAGYFSLRPDTGYVSAGQVPALSFLLLLTILLALVMPGLSFFFDRLRVPTILLLVLVSVVSYAVADSDHYYSVLGAKTSSVQSPVDLPTPIEALRNRAHGTMPSMVVVATSGGGIAASLWTARVLVGLRRDPQFGEIFGRTLAFMSGVSGGGVGAMYFVDRYTAEKGPPGPEDDKEIRDAAGDSSLGAVGWGIAYPDLWRVLAPWLPFEGTKDRAWAQEEVWGDRLKQKDVTLRQWSKGVKDGWRPAMVFNSTISETGDRFLMATVGISAELPGEHGTPWPAFTLGEKSLGMDFGMDLHVVTAARLSSTFPYVSPIARASVDGDTTKAAYHIADGGYFDNFGIVTAADWIREVVPVFARELGGKRILLIQIRQDPPPPPEPKTGTGWLNAVVGPIVTLTAARSSTQILRNTSEVELLERQAKESGVTLESVVFAMNEPGPLSWHLSSEERSKIRGQWAEAIQSEPGPYAMTREYFEDEADRLWGGGCQKRRSLGESSQRSQLRASRFLPACSNPGSVLSASSKSRRAFSRFSSFT